MSRPDVDDAIVLTLLYCPGDHPERVAKAMSGPADVVIIDLEDAVAPSAKDAARAGLAELVGDGSRAVQVRVNGARTPWHAADLAAVAGLPITVAVRVPGCDDRTAIRRIAAALPGRRLALLVESALGVERAFDLATADAAVGSIGLGEADLRANLGVTDDSGLDWARGRIVNAAAAAGLAPPAMSVFTQLGDPDALAKSCAAGRAIGFLGRAAIHPQQLDVITATFAPAAGEITAAKHVVAAASAAETTDQGALVLPDGRFIDIAIVRQAQRVLMVATATSNVQNEQRGDST